MSHTISRRAALAAVPAIAVTAAVASSSTNAATVISPHFAAMRERWQANQATWKARVDLTQSDEDELFDEYMDSVDAVLYARAETFGDVLVQHEALLVGNGGYEDNGCSFSRAEIQWIIGLDETIRRLAGAS